MAATTATSARRARLFCLPVFLFHEGFNIGRRTGTISVPTSIQIHLFFFRVFHAYDRNTFICSRSIGNRQTQSGSRPAEAIMHRSHGEPRTSFI